MKQKRPAKSKKVWRRILIVLIIILLLFVILFEVGKIVASRFFDEYYGLLDIRTGELSDNVPDTKNQVSSKLAVKVADPMEITDLDYYAAVNHTKRLAFADKYDTDTINILLLGNDSRGNDYSSRSDAIILVSVNTKEKTLTLTSIMRDTMIEIPGYSNHRLNQAYEWGGTELLLKTIKENYGIDVDATVLFNFDLFEAIVDFFGGVDIVLQSDEIDILDNFYLKELNRLEGYPAGTDYIGKENGGSLLHLSGRQTLAYVRVRYVEGYEASRNTRQRTIIEILLKKMKEWDFETAESFAREIFPSVRTNISKNTCRELLSELVYFRDYTIESARIPTEEDIYYGDIVRDNYFFGIDFDHSLQQYADTVNREGTYQNKKKNAGFEIVAWLWRKLWQ